MKHFNWNCDESRMDKHKEGLANVIIYHLMPESKMYLDSEEIIRKKLNITYKKYLVEKVEVKSTKYDKF